mmetsp:Transcript_81533/g.195593  ORF Transcript_81533/g.195593 Transcript_81533/m.195593 type:complete len:233 (-) Transcript_81533:67-765(-)
MLTASETSCIFDWLGWTSSTPKSHSSGRSSRSLPSSSLGAIVDSSASETDRGGAAGCAEIDGPTERPPADFGLLEGTATSFLGSLPSFPKALLPQSSPANWQVLAGAVRASRLCNSASSEDCPSMRRDTWTVYLVSGKRPCTSWTTRPPHLHQAVSFFGPKMSQSGPPSTETKSCNSFLEFLNDRQQRDNPRPGKLTPSLSPYSPACSRLTSTGGASESRAPRQLEQHGIIT